MAQYLLSNIIGAKVLLVKYKSLANVVQNWHKLPILLNHWGFMTSKYIFYLESSYEKILLT